MRILFVTDRVPWPLHSGSTILTWHTLQHLGARHDVDVVARAAAGHESPPPVPIRGRFLTVPRSNRHLMGRWRHVLALASARGAIESAGFDRHMRLALLSALQRSAYDLVVVDHLRLGWAVPIVRQVAPQTRILFRSQNCETDVRRLYIRCFRGSVSQALLGWEAYKTERFERRVVGAADAVAAVTDEDAALHRLQGARLVYVAPPGCDLNVREVLSEEKVDCSVVLTGSFEYLAKELNALFLVREVYPAIRAQVPAARLFLVGSGPSVRLRRAARRAGVTVTGRVDDAWREASRYQVFVMPTIVGGGLELKGLQAMAAGLPIVATPLAVRGLRLEEGTSVLLGRRPEEMAAGVVRLLRDTRLRESVAGAARTLATTSHTWEQALEKLDTALGDLSSRPVAWH